VQFTEIIEHWTGWCPKKQRVQRVQIASGTDFLSMETSMEAQKGMRSRTKGVAAIILVLAFVAALAGMRLEFDSMQSLDWFMSDSKALEGYQWLANNTEGDATVLAWWDYADGIEKIGHRGAVINEASESIKQTIGGYSTPGRPWRKIEYWLWYPYEDDEKVRDVANFFVTQNATTSVDIARKYGAGYALVLYPDDQGKFFAVIAASGANLSDYYDMKQDPSSPEAQLRMQTVGMRMAQGDQIDGFSKAFDNGRMRIYKLP
jgi:asparagine N-glycosylation enzyme membrane subunit Stt3